MRSLIFIITLFVFCFTKAQVLEEVNPPSFIKSIIFKGDTSGDQFPIIQLRDKIYLEFDDVNGNEVDYYYKITHCNFDWTPSDLIQSQYLDGFDNQRIVNYENSFNTLQMYSNYRMELPNNQTRLKISGNYMLSIYDDDDELVFSRRFIVYKNIASVGVSIHRSRDIQEIQEKQVVQFAINSPNLLLRNPNQLVKVAVLQNYNWQTAITDLKPQFTLGTELIYRYSQESGFYAGNEFYNFENKDVRGATVNISRIELKDIYHNYLYTNASRAGQPYTFNPDINGDFLVTTLHGDNPSLESEYAMIHFSLEPYLGSETDTIYVFGKFNNFGLDDEVKMEFNPETGLYEKDILLKQGFYNYKYVAVNDKGQVDYNKIDGSYFQTENDYLVIVYYRDFGALYDSIIAIGSAKSDVIKN